MNQKARRIRLAAYSCWLVTFTCCVLLLWSGAANAEHFSLKISDKKSIDIYIDLPIDIKSELNEANDTILLKLEEWSEFYNYFNPNYIIKKASIRSDSCKDMIDDIINKGYDVGNEILFKRIDILECAIIDKTADNYTRYSTWYFWHRECPCFIEVSSDYENVDFHNYIIQPVIDSFREAYSKPFADSTAASRLIAARDPTIPKDAIDIAEVQRQIGEAQRRTRDAKQKRAQLIARLRSRLKELEERERQMQEREYKPPKIPDNQVIFRITNSTGKHMLVSFFEYKTQYAESISAVYPRRGSSWIVAGGAQDQYQLTCTPGRYVCIGAEFQFDRKSQSGLYWGVSLAGSEACTECCLKCGGKSIGKKLTWDGKRYPPSVARRGGGNDGTAQALGTILGIVGGAIIGSQSAPAYQPAPTYRRPPSAYPRPPAPRRAPRQSDISR